MHFSPLASLASCLTLVTLISAHDSIQTPLSPSFPKTIREALKSTKIIPTVLDDFHPTCLLHITYPSTRTVVHYGNLISPKDTSSKPVVQIECPGSTSTTTTTTTTTIPLSGKQDVAQSHNFTFALTDPDAPSRKKPKWSEMCHWIGTVSGQGEIGELVEYKEPGPPKGTGKHRYVFVLMRGATTNLTEPGERIHWGYGKGKGRHTKGVQKWADEQGLEIVGANWFVAKHEK